MDLLRWLVGRMVLLVNWLTWPAAGRRPPAEQAEVEQALAGYALYQFNACPFCVKVRRAMRRLNLPIELRNARVEGAHRDALRAQGDGVVKVPCLRIDHPDGTTRWMYESDDIVAHLNERFPLTA